jgi:hypothetical protein
VAKSAPLLDLSLPLCLQIFVSPERDANRQCRKIGFFYHKSSAFYGTKGAYCNGEQKIEQTAPQPFSGLDVLYVYHIVSNDFSEGSYLGEKEKANPGGRQCNVLDEELTHEAHFDYPVSRHSQIRNLRPCVVSDP